MVTSSYRWVAVRGPIMSAEQTGSVSCLLTQLRSGHAPAAEQQLWNRYFAQLVRRAHKYLAGHRVVDVDGEDIALSALNSFFGRLQRGAFPELHDRTGLWPLLVTITARKAANALHRDRAARRTPARLAHLPDLDVIIGTEPSPGFAAEVADEMRRLFDLLGDDTLRNIARLKLEGHSSAEIAELLNVTERTVNRKLDRIRSEWKEMVQP
jgi:DNA-directed RNA polymerase specialized sigma24 family protein